MQIIKWLSREDATGHCEWEMNSWDLGSAWRASTTSLGGAGVPRRACLLHSTDCWDATQSALKLLEFMAVF